MSQSDHIERLEAKIDRLCTALRAITLETSKERMVAIANNALGYLSDRVLSTESRTEEARVPKHPDCVSIMCGREDFDCGRPGPCYVNHWRGRSPTHAGE